MRIVVANWKMNYCFEDCEKWLESFFEYSSSKYQNLKDLEMVVCPPAVLLDYLDGELMEDGFQFLEKVAKSEGRSLSDFSVEEINNIMFDNRPVKLGGQDCHYENSGSFTGDISAKMLRSVGCNYVILGHSERRVYHKETNSIISQKVKSAVTNSLFPIVCVGENKQFRDQGEHLHIVEKQILDSIPINISYKRLIIAYEPLWSIGTGILPSIDEIDEMTRFIRSIIDERFHSISQETFILYGGSVSSENSKNIMSLDEVNGLLVGKASLDAKEFIDICTS